MSTAGPKKGTRAAAAKAARSRVPPARMTLAETMGALGRSGSAQTRQTYARHGAPGPMFGVSFTVLKTLVRRIGVDHELAQGLWATSNFDARNLAVKVADPALMSPDDLGRWAREAGTPMLVGYVAQLAAEGPHAAKVAARWVAASDPAESCGAWLLIAQMALRDERSTESWFRGHLARIEKRIHSVGSAQREAMNQAVIAIGCRSVALRKAAAAAARRIGKVEVDHGDTACTTPDAASYIEKAWAHSTSRGFPSPAAQERTRVPVRIRC